MTPHRHNRVMHHLGRRGAVLVLFGAAWTIIGYGTATVHQDRFSHPGGPLAFMDTAYPAFIWVIGGLVALSNGFLRRRFHNEDAAGYAGLMIPCMLWTGGYVASYTLWLWSQLTGDAMYGNRQGLLGAAVYAVLVVTVYIIANWPDPLDQPYPASLSEDNFRPRS